MNDLMSDVNTIILVYKIYLVESYNIRSVYSQKSLDARFISFLTGVNI